jgi:hypothetical protein
VEVIVVEVLGKVCPGAFEVAEHDSTSILRQWCVEVLAGQP